MEELLILNYDWLNKLKSSLFNKLKNLNFRNNFLNNPTNVIVHEFYKQEQRTIYFGEVSSANLLLLNLLNDQSFLTWSEHYKKNINKELHNIIGSSLYIKNNISSSLLNQTKLYIDTINAILTSSESGKKLPLHLRINNNLLTFDRQPNPVSSLVPLVTVAIVAIAATVVVVFHVSVAHPTYNTTINVSVRTTHPIPVSVRVAHPIPDVDLIPSTDDWGGLTRIDLKIVTDLIYKNLIGQR